MPIDIRRLTRWDGLLAVIIFVATGLLFLLVMFARLGEKKYKARKTKQVTSLLSEADSRGSRKEIWGRIKARPSEEIARAIEGKTDDEAIDAVLALEGTSMALLGVEYIARLAQVVDTHVDTIFSDMPRYIIFSAFQGAGFLMGVVSLLALVYAVLVSAQPPLPVWLR